MQKLVSSLAGPTHHQQNVLLYSPDGKTLASGYNSGEIVLWNMQTKQVQGTLLNPIPSNPYGANILHLEFSPDGRLLIATDFSGRTEIWDVQAQKVVHDFSQGANKSSSYTASFLDNHTVVLGIGDGSKENPFALVVADAATGTIQQSFLGEPHRLNFIAFNPRNQTFVTVNENGGVALWKRATGAIQHRFDLSADQPDNYQPAGERTIPAVGLITVGKSHQQEIVATISNEIVLLDPTTLTPLAQPFFETGQINSIEQSPDGSYLLIALQQGKLGAGYNPVVVRPLDLATQQQTACQVAHRNLTRTEWNDLIGTDYQYQTLCPEFP